MEYSLEVYKTPDGKVPFERWLLDLSDIVGQQKINIRLHRLRHGNFGDCKAIGDGVFELKIDFGPGYRVYFGVIGKKILLILCAGTKRAQQKDIDKAKQYLSEFKK